MEGGGGVAPTVEGGGGVAPTVEGGEEWKEGEGLLPQWRVGRSGRRGRGCSHRGGRVPEQRTHRHSDLADDLLGERFPDLPQQAVQARGHQLHEDPHLILWGAQETGVDPRQAGLEGRRALTFQMTEPKYCTMWGLLWLVMTWRSISMRFRSSWSSSHTIFWQKGITSSLHHGNRGWWSTFAAILKPEGLCRMWNTSPQMPDPILFTTSNSLYTSWKFWGRYAAEGRSGDVRREGEREREREIERERGGLRLSHDQMVSPALLGQPVSPTLLGQPASPALLGQPVSPAHLGHEPDLALLEGQSSHPTLNLLQLLLLLLICHAPTAGERVWLGSSTLGFAARV